MSPLNWEEVKKKYKPGTMVPHLIGNKRFEILRVTDDAIHFKWAVVSDGMVQRRNLERLVELVAEGVVRPDPVTLTSDYRTLIGDERPTTAVAILNDLGYLSAAVVERNEANG